MKSKIQSFETGDKVWYNGLKYTVKFPFVLSFGDDRSFMMISRYRKDFVVLIDSVSPVMFDSRGNLTDCFSRLSKGVSNYV